MGRCFAADIFYHTFPDTSIENIKLSCYNYKENCSVPAQFSKNDLHCTNRLPPCEVFYTACLCSAAPLSGGINMTYISESHAKAAKALAKNFEKRGMNFCYCESADKAREYILSLIPEGSSVSWGGSESMEEAGVIRAVKEGNYEVIDRKSAKTPEEARRLYGKIVCSDYYLMSTNAFTKGGELVNIDGAANRVACLAHGPAKVIVLASMDKMCSTVEEAVNRIRTMAAPPNALRVNANTPCAATGLCADCLSPDCICCEILITRMSRIPGRITIVLTDEKLGF